MIHIGLVLPSVPGYSETFIKNKIDCLLKKGFRVSLFVKGKKESRELDKLISIFYQVDINNYLHLFLQEFRIKMWRESTITLLECIARIQEKNTHH